jgi:hypothetical protein
MMDFARRLAPPREGDPSRAVPALPSRFEGETPLRPDALDGAEVRDGDTAPVLAAHDDAPPSAVEVAVERPARTPTQPPPEPAAHPRAGPDARPFHPPIVPRRSTGAAVDASKLAVAPVPQSRALAAAPIPRTARQPARRPLSDAALAARTAPAAPPRPFVQVTIDRLEVRAATPRPAPAIRPRGATPSVSLGDYLRQRASKPGGAA